MESMENPAPSTKQRKLLDAAQSSTTTTTATTFFVDHTNSLDFSFMATEVKEAFITQPLTPTSMVLGLGCTRAMTSRVAAQDLLKFCDQHKDRDTTAETTSQFTFANPLSTKCKQKLIICMSDQEYAVQSTEFDIVEQGHVLSDSLLITRKSSLSKKANLALVIIDGASNLLLATALTAAILKRKQRYRFPCSCLRRLRTRLTAYQSSHPSLSTSCSNRLLILCMKIQAKAGKQLEF